ncbi:MAG: OmpA family protein [Candidatus Kapabacteria bacterium]|jgi:outer membrane protein OmpA-like peptidoglycan-associated protein|nr:OmpA family protein [Candidatus Kapabacteria bacterium]
MMIKPKILLITAFLLISAINYSNAQMIKAVVAVTGSIRDELNKEPLTVSIEVFDNTGKKVNSTKSNSYDEGYYFVTGLKPGNVYTFDLQSENHFSESLTISVPNSDKYLEISRDFNLKPLTKNAKIPLAVSPFEYNKSKLRFGSAVALERLASTLKNNPNVKFTILSYPDNDKDANENKELTRKRADALQDYFVIQGVEESRIQIRESAATDPDLPPPTEKRAKGKKYIGTTYIVINDF